MNLSEVNVELNLAQLLISLAHQKHVTWEGGRGVGKSFGGSWRVKSFVEQMPRAKIGVVGSTFEQIHLRTLPSTVKGLSRLGFHKGIHFFVGTRAPKQWRWDEAYEPPLSYDQCIQFFNGTTFQFISLNNSEAGRGFNLDGVIGDEAALFDYEKLQNNVLLSRRGNLEYFEKCPLHRSTFFMSTTPVNNKGKWFIKRQELAKKFPNEYFHMITESAYNRKNLGDDWFREMRRELLPHIYAAEIDCIRSGGADRPFYPIFNYDLHTYLSSNDRYILSIANDDAALSEKSCKFDEDLNVHAPLDIALDYNAAINWLVVGQQHGDYYRNLNALFVKSPKTVLDVVQEFCDYYKYQVEKTVNYYFDHTAVHKDAVRTTTYSEEVQKVLVKNGWKVNMIYCGQAPKHETKKLFFELLMSEKDAKLLRLRINQVRCKYMISSIENAGTLDGRDGMKKDKSSEKDKNIPDEEATHGSDAFDTLNYFRLTKGMQQHGYFFSAVR